jgi:hypothetical protein
VKNGNKVTALRKKQKEFNEKGLFSQAIIAKIIADFMEESSVTAPASP